MYDIIGAVELPDQGNPQCLCLDQSARLWVGTNGKGVYLYNRNEDEFIQYLDDNNTGEMLLGENMKISTAYRKHYSAADGFFPFDSIFSIKSFIRYTFPAICTCGRDEWQCVRQLPAAAVSRPLAGLCFGCRRQRCTRLRCR